jgi:hypothetical protein
MIATGKIRTHNPQHTQGRAHRLLDQPTFRDAYSPNYYLINVKHVGFKQQKMRPQFFGGLVLTAWLHWPKTGPAKSKVVFCM